MLEVNHPVKEDGVYPWLSLCLGLLFSFCLLEFARTHWLIQPDKVAYGSETKGFDVSNSEVRDQCSDARDSAQCVNTYQKSGSPPAILWLGNSQLMAINHAQPGDKNAPFLLRQRLAERGYFVATYSIPNANLAEHALIIDAVASQYKTKMMLLPVVYDDLREQGLRADVAAFADDPAVLKRLQSAAYWPELKPLLDAHQQITSSDVQTPTKQTIQARVENKFVAWLQKHSLLWKSRIDLRDLLSYAVHTLRNKILGIHSTTKRTVDGGVYRQRMILLDQMLASARKQGIEVIIYIPPYRRDIDGPYIEADYQRFKAEVAILARRNAARFSDLESIVPGSEWGMVTDPLFGLREYDFMHFTANGHARLANALDQELVRAGY